MSMKDKKEKFSELANNRVNKALNLMRLIGNLANKSHYSYSEEDSKQIISALESELKTLKSKFSKSKPNKDNKFSLK